MANVVIIGPAHPLRGGGMTTFNHRLATQFLREGHNCSIYSFYLQYPGFLFPGTSQFSTEPPPKDLIIHSAINSVSPVNWIRVGERIRKLKPDLVIVRFWLPFMGPALGTIVRRIKKNKHTKIICIADNVIPHEKRAGDKAFTTYFLKSCDGFITMSEKVMKDLRTFQPDRPAKLVHHPLYDNFGEIITKHEARKALGIAPDEKLLLFFGFIRHYKGLDLLLQAMADEQLKKTNIKLLIAGEFYESEKKYLDQIESLGIRDRLILHTHFIPDDAVRNYLCAADAVVQPYRNATQSGVTPLSYHFEKPMIVTNVGGLPSMVANGKAGLVVEPDSLSISNGILRFYELGEEYFIPHLREEKKKYSWKLLVGSILELMTELPNNSAGWKK